MQVVIPCWRVAMSETIQRAKKKHFDGTIQSCDNSWENELQPLDEQILED
jgi:hypothetical protein